MSDILKVLGVSADVVKAKYIKREGTPGNYKYTYAKEGTGGGKVARRDAERAVWSILPKDSKSGKGKERKVMLTGDMAVAAGVPDYTSIKLADMTADQLAGAASVSWKAPHYSKTPLHEESHGHGSYHVEDHGAGIHATYFTAPRGKKQIIANASSMEAAQARIDQHVKDATSPDPRDRLSKLKKIVSESSAGQVDGRRVDMQTARVMVQVAESLNDKNRKKFLEMPFGQASEFAWNAVSKSASEGVEIEIKDDEIEIEGLGKSAYSGKGRRTGSPGNYKYEYPTVKEGLSGSGAKRYVLQGTTPQGESYSHNFDTKAEAEAYAQTIPKPKDKGPEKSPPISGMEGPFTYPSGRELYYDPREKGGSYYDRGQDRYLDHQEAHEAMKSQTALAVDLLKGAYRGKGRREGTPGNYRYIYDDDNKRPHVSDNMRPKDLLTFSERMDAMNSGPMIGSYKGVTIPSPNDFISMTIPKMMKDQEAYRMYQPKIEQSAREQAMQYSKHAKTKGVNVKDYLENAAWQIRNSVQDTMSSHTKQARGMLARAFEEAATKVKKSQTAKAIDLLKGAMGTGFSTGQQLGAAASTPGGAAAAAPGAVQAVSGTMAGAARSPGSPSPSAASSSSAPSAGGNSGSSDSGSVDQTAKACKGCLKGMCPDHVGKALTSRSLVIPFHMRGPHYDPAALERSATTQTSRMYTALAPAVRDTVQSVKDEEHTDPRINAMKSAEAASEYARKMRKAQAESLVPRTDGKFTR